MKKMLSSKQHKSVAHYMSILFILEIIYANEAINVVNRSDPSRHKFSFHGITYI